MSREDADTGARFDDVVFRTYAREGQGEGGHDQGFEWPYRQFLPQGIEGMLLAGRSNCVGPTVNRNRYKMLLMGQAVGMAAALAARAGVPPRQVDVSELRRILHHRYHVPMETDPARLAELGLLS